MSIGQNMLMISSYWGERDTFKIIPVTVDCPFVEGIYDPASGTLVVLGKDKKNVFTMLEKLDDDGNPIKAKTPQAQMASPVKRERKSVETYHEHYILTEKEQEEFLKLFVINLDSYNYKSLMKKDEKIIMPETPKIELATEMPKR